MRQQGVEGPRPGETLRSLIYDADPKRRQAAKDAIRVSLVGKLVPRDNRGVRK